MSNLKEELVSYAQDIGLDLIGVATPEPFDRYIQELDSRAEHYDERYAYRVEGWQKMANPLEVLPAAKSVVVMGFFYLKEESQPTGARGKLGRIVTYGHLGILKRVRLMRAFLQKKGHRAVIGAHRKEAAMRAGLGYVGKHNLVINPEYGSWVAYQSIVTDAELEADEPSTADPCGDCDLCLKACPSHALFEPRRLDPRKCVTYLLTSKDVPEDNLSALGNYILGCDVCQEACPKNANLIPKKDVESLLPDNFGMYPSITDLLHLSEDAFQEQIIGSISRKASGRPLLNMLMKNRFLRDILQKLMKTVAKGKEVLPETFVHASGNLDIYKRNALVAAGNLGDPAMLDSIRSLKDHPYLGKYADWAERTVRK